MNTICCSPLHRPDANAFGSLQIFESSRSSLDARASAEISLITADGDKVTLSAVSSLRTEHTTYDFLGRMQGQPVGAHAEKLQISTTTEAAATVQGALDEEELEDIKRLLGALETTAANFFSGESDRVLTSFADIGELDSIAGFKAALSYSREGSAERATSASEAPAGDAETAPKTRLSEPRRTNSFLNKLDHLARQLEDEKGLDKLPRRFTQLFKKVAHNLALDELAEDSKRSSGLEHASATRHQ